MNQDLLNALHPPRLPEAFTQLGLADLIAVFGLGLLLAAASLMLFAPLIRRRPVRPGLSARIQDTQALPPEERMLALARILAEQRGVALPEDQRQALYAGRDGDPSRIERMIRGAAR